LKKTKFNKILPKLELLRVSNLQSQAANGVVVLFTLLTTTKLKKIYQKWILYWEIKRKVLS